MNDVLKHLDAAIEQLIDEKTDLEKSITYHEETLKERKERLDIVEDSLVQFWKARAAIELALK
jgi:prefoldin subunit 5